MCVWGKRGKRRRKREGGKVGEKGEREGQNDGGRRGSGARAREGEGEKKGEVVTERGRKGKRMGETRGFEKPTRRMPLQMHFQSKVYFKGSCFREHDLDYQGETTSQTMTSTFFKVSK